MKLNLKTILPCECGKKFVRWSLYDGYGDTPADPGSEFLYAFCSHHGHEKYATKDQLKSLRIAAIKAGVSLRELIGSMLKEQGLVKKKEYLGDEWPKEKDIYDGSSCQKEVVKKANKLWKELGGKEPGGSRANWYVTGDVSWGPGGEISTDLSKIDVMKKGEFIVTDGKKRLTKKVFKRVWKAILWSYDDVVDKDSLDHPYFVCKLSNGKSIGGDIADFAWE